MRDSLLTRDPDIERVTMDKLVAIADKIEHESVRRYEMLAQTMDRRGEAAAAAAFRVMLDEERSHVTQVQRWASSLGVPMKSAGTFEWQLPADLFSSWDQLAGSARITPYRAFAIAVENEQRAFQLYSYLAANAEDPRVAVEAERMAMEELRHASVIRRWRRAAWRRERQTVDGDTTLAVASMQQLHAFLAQREARIAARYRALSKRLSNLGDDESARLLDELLQSPSWPAEAADAIDNGSDILPGDVDPVHLLVAAQEPLEALSEALDRMMPTVEGDLFAEVEKALSNVVTRLARLSLQAGRRMGA
jgi:rubrerythrin